MTPFLSTSGGGSSRGFGRRNFVSAPAGPSAAPSNLTATAGYAGASNTAQMSLSWTNGDATAQTEVYNGASLVTTVNAAVTTYNVTNLNASTSYSFTVKHIKNGVRSNASNQATKTTNDYKDHYISQYCTGLNLYYTYADGNGSTYDSLYQSDSSTCATNYNISATGGTITDANGWRTHEFTSTGTFSVSSCDAGAQVAVILAGGGGGSGNSYYPHCGGGGGGGSLEYNSAQSISATNYSIVVGAGGAATPHANQSYKGANTTGFSITAYGGGHGANGPGAVSGGSGGGGGDGLTTGASAGNGSNVNAGGNGDGDRTAGGGGGAGGAGGSGHWYATDEYSPDYPVGIGGGGGSALTIGFSPYALCGGGGGGAGWNGTSCCSDRWYAGSGGSGAGDGGSADYFRDPIQVSCTNGSANRGGGAGGGGYYVNSCSGGSGIVLVRYRIS